MSANGNIRFNGFGVSDLVYHGGLQTNQIEQNDITKGGNHRPFLLPVFTAKPFKI